NPLGRILPQGFSLEKAASRCSQFAMAKYSLPPFSVAIDTNALFPKDPSKLIGSQFIEIWKECSSMTKLDLIIPRVVRDERLYQLVTWAEQSRVSVTRS